MSIGIDRRSAIKSDPIAQLERMYEIREFEQQVNDLFAAGTIRGTTHLCLGQEALAVGLAAVINTDDPVSATYRGHGIALALGMTPNSILSEIMGKAEGCCGGLGGSMHLCDMELGLLPTSAIIGGGMPIAAGAALAFQNNNEKRVAVAVFGDGATNIGAFHETLNLAAIWNLPVVFICDNNVYGEYSRINLTTPIEDLHLRGNSYNMPNYAIDGMDIDEVVTGITSAVDRARSGGGPTFIEAKTYRFAGHSRADQGLYRPEGELDYWRKKDPILVTETKLIDKKIINAAKIDELKKEIKDKITAVVEKCKAGSEPVIEDMFKNIWTEKAGAK